MCYLRDSDFFFLVGEGSGEGCTDIQFNQSVHKNFPAHSKDM